MTNMSSDKPESAAITDMENSYAELSVSMYYFSKLLEAIESSDFAQLSRSVLTEQAKILKTAEDTIAKLAADAGGLLSTISEDHPGWRQAKKNFDYTTVVAAELREVRERLEHIMAKAVVTRKQNNN